MCGMAAIAFRRDGLALAAFSRISGYVYVWTLQPAWAARMSANQPSSGLSTLLGGGYHASHVTHLQPFRVMAAPPQLLLGTLWYCAVAFIEQFVNFQKVDVLKVGSNIQATTN